MENNLVEQNEKVNKKNDGLKITFFVLNIIGIIVISLYIISAILFVISAKKDIPALGFGFMPNQMLIPLFVYAVTSLILSIINRKRDYKVNIILASILLGMIVLYYCLFLWSAILIVIAYRSFY